MNLRHETFIHEMITHGNRARAYLAAYPASSVKAAYNNACRLLAIPAVHSRIHNAVRKVEEEVIQQFRQEKQVSLVEISEKRVLLAEIIHAAIGEKQTETKWGSTETKNTEKETNLFPTETFRNLLTIAEVLRAIALDTKLEYGWKQRL